MTEPFLIPYSLWEKYKELEKELREETWKKVTKEFKEKLEEIFKKIEEADILSLNLYLVLAEYLCSKYGIDPDTVDLEKLKSLLQEKGATEDEIRMYELIEKIEDNLLKARNDLAQLLKTSK